MNKSFQNPQHILITGASSGIGRELARSYAKRAASQNNSTLVLAITGRDAARLSQTAEVCRSHGAHVIEKIIDVSNEDDMQKFIDDLDQKYPLDLVIANAGISGGTAGYEAGEPPEQVRHICDINIHGVFHTLHPAIAHMAKRGSGQVAIMSSLAGFRGFPGAPAYGASKAAVKVYGEGLRGALHNKGVCVNVICPGFVKSAMTDKNDYNMPFLMETEKAAHIIINGLLKNKARIAFPWQTAFLAWLFSTLPDSWVQPLLRRLPEKSALKE